ncbi:Nucleotidyltransferase, partial [Violaceomyces palustris]
MSNPFGAEDFIPFDFDDPGPSTSTHNSPPPSNQTTNPNSRSNSLCPRDGTPSNIRRNQARDSVSSRAAGKKRKLDDRDDDGRSKKEKVQARSRHTPWASDVDWEKCRNGAEMLHREIMAFDRWLAPTRPEHEVRVMVIELIRKAITAQWRDAKVFSFGSQETRLYLPQGDIDLVVVSDAMEYQRREGVLRNMAACLRRNNLATDVTVIARAKVPIVKFVCTYGKLKVDISVNQTNGLEAARFVNGWLDKMICMRPLVMTTKHLLAQRGMSEVFSGGLGSYSVIILVISFLQLHPKIQRGEIDPNRNLGVLFLEFLELYGKYFGYDNCGISIRGKGGYFSKARRGWKDERKPFMLCLEDPQDPTNDISKGSYSIINVRSTLGGAFDILTAAICERANDERARNEILNDSNTEEKDPNSLLGTILGVSKSMVRQRKDMEDLYHSGVLQYKLGRPAPPSSPPPARSPPPAQTPR